MKFKRMLSLICAMAVVCSSIVFPTDVKASEYTAAIEALDKDSMEDTRSLGRKLEDTSWQGNVETLTGNIALNKPVTASATAGSYLASYAVDGDFDSDGARWQSGENVSVWTPPVWLKLDLQGASTLTGIRMEFGRKMYGNFQIQTSESGLDDDEWETLATITDVPVGDEQEILYEKTFETPLEAKRYVRLNFTDVNTSAGNKSIAIREVELNGTQEVTAEMLHPTTAQAALNLITELSVSEDRTQVLFPEMDNYEFSLKGSDLKQIISNDGIVSNYSFYDYNVDVILQAVNENDESDRAEKSMVIHVDSTTASYPELFPEVTNPNAEPKIIPSVQEWYGYNGDYVLSADSKIAVNDTHNLNLIKAAENLQADIKEFTGYELAIVTGAGGENDIEICSLPADLYDTGEEGYILLNNDNGLKIYSHTYTGGFYGTVSVEQVFYQQRYEGEYSFPKGIIRDFPKFEVRGVMVDVARAPQRLERLYDYAKILSFYKLNEFHVHLTDNINSHNAGDKTVERWENSKNNEGYFRLESDAFPSLTSSEKSSEYYNDEEGVFGGQPQYSKDEYIKFQEDVEAWGIGVLSELDTPGHSLVINKYVEDYPEEVAQYGIVGDTRRLVGDGIYANGGRDTAELLALSGDNYENSAKFVRVLWDEYLGLEGNDYTDYENATVVNEYNAKKEVFIGDRVHIGADEYWDITTEERQGMLEYITDISEKVEATGKTARIWSELSRYLDPLNMTDDEVKALGITDVEIDMWANGSHENTQKRLAQGFKIVNVDEAYLYGNTARDRRDILNVEYMFETWTPYTVNGYTIPKGEPGLLGAKTALWADVNRMGVTERDVNERVTRGASVLAERIWGGTDADQDFTEFSFKYSRLENGPGVEIASDIESKTELVVDYDFANVAENTLYDISGNAYHGAISGGSIVEEDGMTWLSFDGTAKIETPIDSVDYPYTVQFTVKGDHASNTEDAILFDGYDGRLSMNENGELVVDRSFFNEAFDYTIEADTKADITLVGTQQVTKLYVNGEFKDAIIRTSAAEEDFANVMGTFVFPMASIGEGFHGKLANIKVYQKAMSAEEVKADYDDETAEKVNISQNKGVAGEGRVSSGHDNADEKLHVAWKAIDGDGNTLSGSHAATESDKDSYFYGRHADSFISLDFYKSYKVSEINLQFDAAPAAFTLWKSTDGENWTQIEGDYSGSNVVFQTPVETQYLKLAANNFKLREIEVFEAVDKTALMATVEKAAELVNHCGLSYENKNDQDELFDTYKAASSVLNNLYAVQADVDAVNTALAEIAADTLDPLECEHTTEDILNAKAATCKEEGYTGDVKCAACKKLLAKGEVIAVDKNAHKWDEGVVTPATETTAGEKIYTCQVCQETKKETIPALGTQNPEGTGQTGNGNDSSTVGKVDLPAVGTTREVNGILYTITKADAKEGTVSMVGVKKASTNIVIPDTVKIDEITYSVTAIGKNALKKNKKVKNVTIGKNVTAIGATAFSNCKKLKKITIQSSKLNSKSIHKKAWKGLGNSTKIKVPKAKLKAYKKLFKSKGLSSKVKVIK